MDLTLFRLHLSSYHGTLEYVPEFSSEVGMLLVAVIDPCRVRFA